MGCRATNDWDGTTATHIATFATHKCINICGTVSNKHNNKLKWLCLSIGDDRKFFVIVNVAVSEFIAYIDGASLHIIVYDDDDRAAGQHQMTATINSVGLLHHFQL